MEGMYYGKETDWGLFFIATRENNPFFGLFLKFQQKELSVPDLCHSGMEKTPEQLQAVDSPRCPIAAQPILLDRAD